MTPFWPQVPRVQQDIVQSLCMHQSGPKRVFK